MSHPSTNQEKLATLSSIKTAFHVSTGATNIVRLPLAFVRSGYVNLTDGKVYGVGSSGYGRSRTARSSTGAYYLYMAPTDVFPSNDTGRRDGFSFRWL